MLKGRLPNTNPKAAVTDLPRIEIHYCTQCRWLLRAGWLAQELLSSFEAEIGEVALRPGTGGVFEIRAGGVLVWERKADGGFPDAAELKRRVRDVIAPDKPLGHAERKSAGQDPAASNGEPMTGAAANGTADQGSVK